MTAPALSPRRWWALGALVLSALIIGLDGTIINVALPTLANELGADSAQLQWIGGGYLLALSATLLPIGLLGDRYGLKRMLLVGMTIFGLASLAGIWAGSPGQVIAIRAVLGFGAAMIMPLSLAILPRIFGPEEIPKAVATWTAATALGMPIGPIVGGWLLEHFRWTSIFAFNLPVVALALTASVVLLPKDPKRAQADPATPSTPFDAWGTVLSAAGITSLVYGTILVPQRGWGSPLVLGAIVAGGLLLIAFVLRQCAFAHPLVDLGLFADARFRWGALIAVFVNFAVMGILFVVPQYLEGVLGNDAFGTGLRLLPLIGGLMVSAMLGESLVPKIGPRVVITTGLALLAAGALLGATTGDGDGYPFTAGWLALAGLGFGLAVVPATSMVMASLPAGGTGSGASLLETVQQVGGVLGVAVLGSVLSAGYLDRLSTTGVSGPDAAAARDSLTAAGAVAEQLHDPALRTSAHDAFTHGMGLVLLVCGVIALIAAGLAAVYLPRRGKAEADPADTGPANDGPVAGEAADATGGSEPARPRPTAEHGELIA